MLAVAQNLERIPFILTLIFAFRLRFLFIVIAPNVYTRTVHT